MNITAYYLHHGSRVIRALSINSQLFRLKVNDEPSLLTNNIVEDVSPHCLRALSSLYTCGSRDRIGSPRLLIGSFVLIDDCNGKTFWK